MLLFDDVGGLDLVYHQQRGQHHLKLCFIPCISIKLVSLVFSGEKSANLSCSMSIIEFASQRLHLERMSPNTCSTMPSVRLKYDIKCFLFNNIHRLRSLNFLSWKSFVLVRHIHQERPRCDFLLLTYIKWATTRSHNQAVRVENVLLKVKYFQDKKFRE